MSKRPAVMLVMPHYGGDVAIESAMALFSEATFDPAFEDKRDILIADHGSSLLANTFNNLWCLALNWHEKHPDQEITHFAMLHADVGPEPIRDEHGTAVKGWLDILFEELEATDADICSAVIPIKSKDGVTSTAISSTDPFRVTRRLTMAEVMQLPPTFDAEACGYPGETILANTGCWLCRFDRLWKYDVHFEINDKIIRDQSGQYVPKCEPEDWNFSRQVWKHGGKIVATRKVPIRHIGRSGFRNDSSWGEAIQDHMANGVPLPALANRQPTNGKPRESVVLARV